MKLEKNNKYSGKKILSTLKAVILSSTLLMGCGSVKAEEIESAPVATPIPEIVLSQSTDNIDYFDFMDITDEEINKRISEIDIKNPDKICNMNYVKTVVTIDDNGDYQVLLTSIVEDEMVADFYDVFTEKYLFTLKNSNGFYYENENSYYYDMDLSNIDEKTPYFDDKEIVAIGDNYAMIYFVNDYLNEVKQQIGLKYNTLPNKYYDCIYEYYNSIIDGDFYETPNYELNFSISELAKQYVRFLPNELRMDIMQISFHQ